MHPPRRPRTEPPRSFGKSYVFLTNMCSKAEVASLVHDRYHTYFLDCNRLDVADAMVDGARPGLPKHPGPANDQDLMASIHGKLGTLLLYARQTMVATRKIWCVRAICPGAFLHIDNSNHFNLECGFSDNFLKQVLVERAQVMVPFP